MKRVKVFQIGLGSFGRHGFEKFIEMEGNLPEADIEICGVCDRDLERLRSAEKFAEAHETEVETFHTTEEMYTAAEQASGDEVQVLIYDAGPTDQHPDHIYESLERGFYHVAEKPSSMNRKQHLREKQLADSRNVIWKVDFIERENPVVKKTLEILEDEKPEIEEIQVFRESSVGVEKLLDPVKRLGVKGGDILDKMIHEIYVLDFLEAADQEFDLELEKAEAEEFMAKNFDSQKLMSLDGGYTEEINDKTATGMSSAEFSAEETKIRFHSSWLGLSADSQHRAKEIKEKIGFQVFNRNFREHEGQAFLDEEARFFIVKGERNLLGDLLHEKLYDLETGERIETRENIHDQLYRVLENSVLEAAGLKENSVSEKELDIFMNAIFDVRDEVIDRDDFREVLESGKAAVRNLVLEDGKILENEESERIAG